jgi:CRP-like cAMP-binding protein
MLDAVAHSEFGSKSWSDRFSLADALLDQHPVLRASPGPLRESVIREGQLNRCASGERFVSTGAVGFVLRGSLAVFDRKDLACVHLLGPGSSFGWEASLLPEQGEINLLALLDSEWIALPATVPMGVMGMGWVERVFARHALDHLTALQAASACHAVHAVPQRVANLIRRLSHVSDAEVRTTQAALAKAVGVQRTSVNASIKTLERAGALSVRRGRMRIRCHATLSELACGC